MPPAHHNVKDELAPGVYPSNKFGANFVSVQVLCETGRSDGPAVPWSAASAAATRKTSSGRPCCRQVATTVSTRSASRLPAALSDPKLPLRHNTTGRKARAHTLFVGATLSTGAMAQGAATGCGRSAPLAYHLSERPV